MWRTLLILILWCGAGAQHPAATGTHSMPFDAIEDRNFPLRFLDELTALADSAAQGYLNELLDKLADRSEAAAPHLEELRTVRASAQLDDKIVFVKQLLDMQRTPGGEGTDTFDTLRNVNFLKKLRLRLQTWREEKILELRQMRVFQLCVQFREVALPQTERRHRRPPPYSREAVLMPLGKEELTTTTSGTPAADRTIRVDILDFGRRLYANVKRHGSELIDEYLSTIQHLLEEVIEEKPEPEKQAAKLNKLLREIEEILRIPDFYEKRMRLYAYLQNTLAEDYEQFKNSPNAQQDLMDIFAKLKRKGLDLFVSFLFSNFEFLERLHEELRKLLPPDVSAARATGAEAPPLDEFAQLLQSINERYVAFKQDSEDIDLYEAYLSEVKTLHARTAGLPAAKDVHIFEILQNSSMNVGSVTLNMIRAKCDEM